ncbi:MAG: SIMPL domain-containing protein [Alteraurantiacibacter sp.]
MHRNTLPVLAVASFAAMVPAVASAAEVQIQASGPMVELTVTENVPGDPDLATLDAGVTTSAQTAVAAMSQNAVRMTAVIDRIRSLGIDQDDIGTTGINLSPQYEWDEATRTQRFRGYQVVNRVTVKLHDIQRTGAVLDALVAAGATDLGGVGFSVEDPTSAQDRARTQAMRTAEARALDYARMAGFTGVRLLEVSEGQPQFYGGPIPVAMERDVAQAAATPVVPGQVQSGVTISVKFEMTR